MELLELLEQIEDIVESGVSVPFSGGKCIVDREVLLDLIQ